MAPSVNSGLTLAYIVWVSPVINSPVVGGACVANGIGVDAVEEPKVLGVDTVRTRLLDDAHVESVEDIVVVSR